MELKTAQAGRSRATLWKTAFKLQSACEQEVGQLAEDTEGVEQVSCSRKVQKSTPEKGDVPALGVGHLKPRWVVGCVTSGPPTAP